MSEDSQVALSRKSALVVPYWVGRDDIFYGGVEDAPPQGRLPREPGRYGDAWAIHESFRDAVPTRVPGRYLFAGALYRHHFGHILTESIHRLHNYRDSEFSGIVFVCAAQRNWEQFELPGFLFDVLDYFGVPREKAILVKRPAEFDELVITPPGSALMRGPAPGYLDYLDGLYERNHAKLSGLDIPKLEKLYFGRRHICKQGTLMGESYVFAKLAGSGFRYLMPEHFNIFQQVALLKNAREVVFIEGSAIYSAELVGKVEAKVFMVSRRRGDKCFRPHLAVRSCYANVGDMRSVIRLERRDGRQGPASPSFSLRPSAYLKDMVNLGLCTSDTFSSVEYESHEAADLYCYADGDATFARTTLEQVSVSRTKYQG